MENTRNRLRAKLSKRGIKTSKSPLISHTDLQRAKAQMANPTKQQRDMIQKMLCGKYRLPL